MVQNPLILGSTCTEVQLIVARSASEGVRERSERTIFFLAALADSLASASGYYSSSLSESNRPGGMYLRG